MNEVSVKNMKSLSNVLLMSNGEINEKEGTVKIAIRFSEMDQCGIGAALIIRRTGSELCVVTRMIGVVKRRPPINKILPCEWLATHTLPAHCSVEEICSWFRTSLWKIGISFLQDMGGNCCSYGRLLC